MVQKIPARFYDPMNGSLIDEIIKLCSSLKSKENGMTRANESIQRTNIHLMITNILNNWLIFIHMQQFT